MPMTSLEKFMECLKKKGLNKNGCNSSKARSLRELLIEMVWMQCVDDSVMIAAHHGGKHGRARRYILIPAHPYYDKFEKIVGAGRIDYWKSFRQEQLRLRSDKQGKRKIG